MLSPLAKTVPAALAAVLTVTLSLTAPGPAAAHGDRNLTAEQGRTLQALPPAIPLPEADGTRPPWPSPMPRFGVDPRRPGLVLPDLHPPLRPAMPGPGGEIVIFPTRPDCVPLDGFAWQRPSRDAVNPGFAYTLALARDMLEEMDMPARVDLDALLGGHAPRHAAPVQPMRWYCPR